MWKICVNTISMFFLSVIIAGMVVLDAVCEVVFGMSVVIHMMVSVFVVNYDLVSWSFNRTVEMRKTVSMASQPGLNSRERDNCQNCNELHQGNIKHTLSQIYDSCAISRCVPQPQINFIRRHFLRDVLTTATRDICFPTSRTNCFASNVIWVVVLTIDVRFLCVLLKMTWSNFVFIFLANYTRTDENIYLQFTITVLRM